MMIRTTLVAAAALASVSFSLGHAEGAEAPWCAVYSSDQPGAWSCQYRSFEECYPNALAKRGFCNASPYYQNCAAYDDARRSCCTSNIAQGHGRGGPAVVLDDSRTRATTLSL